MRVIYLLRVFQLFVVLRSLWMIYNVSQLCETTTTNGAVLCSKGRIVPPMTVPDLLTNQTTDEVHLEDHEGKALGVDSETKKDQRSTNHEIKDQSTTVHHEVKSSQTTAPKHDDVKTTTGSSTNSTIAVRSKRDQGSLVEIPYEHEVKNHATIDVLEVIHTDNSTLIDSDNSTTYNTTDDDTRELIDVAESDMYGVVNVTSSSVAKPAVIQPILTIHRCLTTSFVDYIGLKSSPLSEPLKGFVLIGALLVLTMIFLLLSMVNMYITYDLPSMFNDTMGYIFHSSMWFLVAFILFFIQCKWDNNWATMAGDSFKPLFPAEWDCVMYTAVIMMFMIGLEAVCRNRLYHDIVLETTYRNYEIVDNPAYNQGLYERTRVY